MSGEIECLSPDAIAAREGGKAAGEREMDGILHVLGEDVESRLERKRSERLKEDHRRYIRQRQQQLRLASTGFSTDPGCSFGEF